MTTPTVAPSAPTYGPAAAGCSSPSQDPAPSQNRIEGIDGVAPYSGDLPSPLQTMWYAPKGIDDAFYVPDQEIRGWVDDAAKYQGVPTELLATVLQNENNPNASTVDQVLQFGERSLTTFADIVDRSTFGLVPDAISGGSSGVANMSRNALQGAADYSENTLCRAVMPDDVATRAFGWRQDSRISGDDLRADLYYASAHLRELTDRVTGVQNYEGPLTMHQVHDIAAAYNGSGPAASRYGDAAVNHLTNAANGTEPLYFYQPR